MIFNSKFEIGDKIYHPTYDSPAGIIIDMMYLKSKDRIEYLISTGFKETSWCTEDELTLEKTIIE